MQVSSIKWMFGYSSKIFDPGRLAIEWYTWKLRYVQNRYLLPTFSNFVRYLLLLHRNTFIRDILQKFVAPASTSPDYRTPRLQKSSNFIDIMVESAARDLLFRYHTWLHCQWMQQSAFGLRNSCVGIRNLVYLVLTLCYASWNNKKQYHTCINYGQSHAIQTIPNNLV